MDELNNSKICEETYLRNHIHFIKHYNFTIKYDDEKYSYVISDVKNKHLATYNFFSKTEQLEIAKTLLSYHAKKNCVLYQPEVIFKKEKQE